MAGRLFCLVGIDGSGKTTLAKSLTKFLRAKGVNAEYTWAGFEPTAFLKAMFWLAKRSIYDEDRYTHQDKTKGRVITNRTLSVIYHWVVLLDYVLQIFIKVRLRLLRGISIVNDRYTHDIVVNTAIVLNQSMGEMMNLLDLMEKFTPRPDWLVISDAPEEVAFGRKNDVPSIEFLYERRRRYRYIAEVKSIRIMDTSLPLDLLIEQMKQDAMCLVEQ